jgi:hypothetical protein
LQVTNKSDKLALLPKLDVLNSMARFVHSEAR